MSEPFSRREALKGFIVLLGAAGAVGATPKSGVAQKVHLNPLEPAAVWLGYHENAGTVDPQEFPTYQPDQACNTCVHLQGTAGEPWRPCNLFPGLPVSAAGWCKAWCKKT